MSDSETGNKFLAIKNWHRYQGGKMKKRGDEKRTWVKDYVDKEADPEYSELTPVQRYVLDGCCRLRGRIGQNLPNDPTYIARALSVGAKERHCVSSAVRVLVECGFLLLTNEQHGFPEEIRLEKIREQGKEQGGFSTVVAQPQSEPKAKPPVEQKPPDSGLTVHQLARGMMDELGIPGTISDLHVFSQAISLKSKLAGMTLPAAYQFILARALDAKDRGDFTKPIFWMRDASYDHQPKRSKSDVATSDYHDRARREIEIQDNYHARAGSA